MNRNALALALSVLVAFCATVHAQQAKPADPPPASAQEEPAADNAAPVVDVPLPWKTGQVLRYDFEAIQAETAPGKREKSRSTSIAELATKRAGEDGYEVHWNSRDSKYEVLEGGDPEQARVREAMKAMADVPMVVALKGDGTYEGVRNLDDVSARMRAILQPLLRTMVQESVDKAFPPGSDAGKRQQALDEAQSRMRTYLDGISAPRVLEGLMTRQVRNIAFYNAGGLEDGASYELETELENPTGAPSFPAKLTFGLWVDKDEPEDVYIEWKSEIDPVKGATALVETVKRLYGPALKIDPKDMPAQVSIVDSGFMVLHRPTGMVEMYEDERTTKFGETANYERNRMRLLDLGHGHEWKAELPQATDPRLSAQEQDAQLCLDAQAETLVTVAACTRLADAPGADAKDRARWLAARASHRGRANQHALMVADLDRAIALQPADANLMVQRATAQFARKDYQTAAADAAKAAQLDPTLAWAQLLWGGALEKQEDYRGAIARYDQALALEPDFAAAVDARCWAKAMSGDWAAARADCDRALQLDPRSWNSYNSRGYIHYRNGRHAEAVADNGKALENQPEVASSWYVRGLARRALGDEAGAKADIAKALELDGEVAERYRRYEQGP